MQVKGKLVHLKLRKKSLTKIFTDQWEEYISQILHLGTWVEILKILNIKNMSWGTWKKILAIFIANTQTFSYILNYYKHSHLKNYKKAINGQLWNQHDQVYISRS